MNGVQQRVHTTATQSLERRVTDIETVLEAMDARIVQMALATKQLVQAERVNNAQYRGEDRLDRHEADIATRSIVFNFIDRGFWGRWWWLWTGR